MTVYAPVPPQEPRRGWFMRVVGFFDNTAKVIGGITALVTAIVAVFALINQLRGGPPIQPVANPTPTSQELVVADQVRKCEERHQMSGSRELRKDSRNWPVEVLSCQWPVAAYTDPDGFTRISIEMVERLNTSEANGDSFSDRVRGPCQEFLLAYDFGKMGSSEHMPAFRAVPGDVLFMTGTGAEPWHRPKSELTFYPERDEVVVVHNGSYYLVTARCIT
jgi:hypothetical protein